MASTTAMTDFVDATSLLGAIPIDYVLGPVVLGVCINAFVYGFSVLQFIQYRTRLFRDSLPVQFLVLWTFIVDTVHTAALCWMLWLYVIDNFTNSDYIFSAPWPFTTTPVFLVLTSAPIQFYFAHRIWCHSQSRALYWLIIMLSLAHVAMGIVATAFAFNHANVHDFKELLPIVDTWLALTALCDGSISVILIYYLVRRRSGFRRHEPLKNRIANAFIESSIATSVFALADLIVYSLVPTTNFHIMLGYCIGRVYTCNLLAMVNARLKQREDEADGVIQVDNENPPFERRLEFSNLNNHKGVPTEVQVSVSIREESETMGEPSPTKHSRATTPDSVHTVGVVDQKSHNA